MTRARILAAVIALALVPTACGQSGDIEVQDVWARTSAGMQNAGAAYMTLVGGDADDRLVAVAVPASIAAMAEIHETVMATDGSGSMSMQQVGAIDIPAGGTVALAPGGYHVMMMNLAEPLVSGSAFELTLTFETAGDRTVTVTVKDEG
jgi:hypothetical protein